MGKKSKANRIVFAGLGIGVLIAVIIPVMLFVFGIGIGDILAQEDPDQLEIPTPLLCGEGTIEMDGFCVPDIIPIIEEPELFCTADQSLLQKIAECEILTGDERFIDVPVSELGTSQEECSSFQTESAVECSLEIDQIIQDIYENLVLPDPPEPNGTSTSIDDAFTQLCDQDPTLIICGDSRSLEILTRVLKTDSAGIQTTVETAFDIPLASFFAEDTSNIDFKTGQLQFEVQVKGDPDFRYMGTGQVDLLIGDQSIFPNPIEVKVDGIADEEGKVDLLFVSPTGATSDLILFDFNDNFDKFPNEATTPVRLNVIELNIAGERDQDFAMVDQDVFTMDIFRDDIKILITDTEGIESRVYPSDSALIINTKTSQSEEVFTGLVRQRTLTSDFRCNGCGCTQHYVSSDQTFEPTHSTILTVPAPIIGQVQIKDLEGSIVHTDAGGVGVGAVDYRELTRNQNYTVTVSSPLINSAPIDYGKSQETNSYTCTQEGTPTLTGFTQVRGVIQPCSTQTTSTYLIVTNEFDLGEISCNIPTEVP